MKGEGFGIFGIARLREGPPDQLKVVRRNGDVVVLPIEDNAVSSTSLSGDFLSSEVLSCLHILIQIFKHGECNR